MGAPAGMELLSEGSWNPGSVSGEWSPGGCGCGSGEPCSCGCKGEGGGSCCGGKPSGEVPLLPDYDGEIWASSVRATVDTTASGEHSGCTPGFCYVGGVRRDGFLKPPNLVCQDEECLECETCQTTSTPVPTEPQGCPPECLLLYLGCSWCLDRAVDELLSGGTVTEYWNALQQCVMGPCWSYETRCGINPYCPDIKYPPVPECPEPPADPQPPAPPPTFPTPGSGRHDLPGAKAKCEEEVFACHNAHRGWPASQRISYCTRKYQECLDRALGCQYGPLPSTSPDCEKYGDQRYLGASLKCFCKCAPDDPWSKEVRGCLACLAAQGADTDAAHDICYNIASLKHGARPALALAACLAKCACE